MRTAFLGGSAIALALSGTTAMAQQSADVEGLDNQEIVVTATRRDQGLNSVPAAVTAITSQQIEEATVRDTQDLTRVAPGLVVTTAASEATAATIRLRGIGTSGTNLGLEGSVGVFIDGVYRSRSGIALTELYDVNQVEVLRGPQSTLFGKNTTAGALILRSKAPTFNWQGEAQAVYGERNTVRLMAATSGPLVADELAFRIAGVFSRRDGYLEDVGLRNNVNNRNRHALRGQLLWNATPEISVRLIADHSRKRENCCGATVVQNGSRSPIIAALGGFVPDNFRDYRIASSQAFEANVSEWGTSVQVDADLGSVDWSTILSYRDFQSDRNGDSDFTNLDLINTPFEHTNDSFLTIESTWRGKLGPVDWLAGLFYFDQDTKQQSAITYGNDLTRYFQRVFPAQTALLNGLYPAGGGDTRRDFLQSSRGWSVFTHNIVEILPGLKATLGLRYLKETKSGSGRFLFNSPSCGRAGVPLGAQQLCPTPDFDSKFEDDAFVGSGALSYEPSSNFTVYASYSRGYKAGGLNLDRTAGLSGTAGSTFLPEEIESYEIGAKGRAADGRARFGLTLFNGEISNFQQNAFTGVAFAISNAAEVRTKGVEIEATLQPVKWFTFNSSVVYNEAVYGEATQEVSLRGRQIVNAPKWTVQSQMAFEMPTDGSSWRPYINANIRWLSDINTSVSLIPQAEQDGYILVGGRIGARSPDGRFDLSVFAQNLTNQYYRTIVFAGVLQPGTFNAYVGEPRVVGVELRTRF